MSCRLIIKDKLRVVLPNGNDSALFGTIFSITQDFQKSLDIYYVSETKGFKEYEKGLNREEFDNNGEVSLRQLMNYINYVGKTTTSKSDVLSLMKGLNITSSKELLTKLSKAEKSGVLIFTRESLQNTKIFSTFEVENILNSVSRQEAVADLVKFLRQNEDFQISESEVSDGDSLFPTGAIKKSTTPQTDSIAHTIVEGEIVENKFNKINVGNRVYSDLRFREGFSADVAFVKNISQEVWDSRAQEVKQVLKAIEEGAKEAGINLNGLEQAYETLNREEVVDFLNTLEEGIVAENFNLINDVIYDYLSEETETAPYELEADEVYVTTSMTEQDMYEKHSLIRVADSLYKRVIKEPYLNLVAKLSNKMGTTSENVIQDVENNYDRNFENFESAKEVYLIKSLLNIVSDKSYKSPNDIYKLTEAVYQDSVAEFEQEFGKWLIKNGNNDFKITERGVEFTNKQTADLAFLNLPNYLKEGLVEYSYLSESIEVPQFLYQEGADLYSGEMRQERAKTILNFENMSEFKGDYSVSDGSLFVKDVAESFIRKDNKLYELVSENGNVSAFREVYVNSADLLSIDKPSAENIEVPSGTVNDKNEANKIISEESLQKVNEQYFKCQ